MQNPGETISGSTHSYTISRLLGQGNFTVFYSGSGPSGPVFIKEYTDPTPLLQREWQAFLAHQSAVLKRLRELDCPHFERCPDDFVYRNRYYQIKEFVAGQPLEETLSTSRDQNYLYTALAASARALTVAHRAGIIHNDLKPAQFLLRSGSGPETGLCLMDFDFAVLWKDRIYPFKQALTPFWFAPETRFGLEALTPAADVFCLGLMVFEAWSGGGNPFADDGAGYLKAIRTGKKPRALADRARLPFPPELDLLYRSMVAPDPEQRPSAEEVFNRLVTLGKLDLKLPDDQETRQESSPKFCRHCGTPVPADPEARFCGGCGKPLPGKEQAGFCSKCGNKISTGARFCGRCGTRTG